VIYFDIFKTFQGVIKEFLKTFFFSSALENEFQIPGIFKE
jgi:hypothetical protein